jgi:hypothetical protein
MLTEIGLIIIIVAWLIQLFYAAQGYKEISRIFVLLYIAGTAILAFSYLLVGQSLWLWLNLACTVAAILVYLTLHK